MSDDSDIREDARELVQDFDETIGSDVPPIDADADPDEWSFEYTGDMSHLPDPVVDALESSTPKRFKNSSGR